LLQKKISTSGEIKLLAVKLGSRAIAPIRGGVLRYVLLVRTKKQMKKNIQKSKACCMAESRGWNPNRNEKSSEKKVGSLGKTKKEYKWINKGKTMGI